MTEHRVSISHQKILEWPGWLALCSGCFSYAFYRAGRWPDCVEWADAHARYASKACSPGGAIAWSAGAGGVAEHLLQALNEGRPG